MTFQTKCCLRQAGHQAARMTDRDNVVQCAEVISGMSPPQHDTKVVERCLTSRHPTIVVVENSSDALLLTRARCVTAWFRAWQQVDASLTRYQKTDENVSV